MNVTRTILSTPWLTAIVFGLVSTVGASETFAQGAPTAAPATPPAAPASPTTAPGTAPAASATTTSPPVVTASSDVERAEALFVQGRAFMTRGQYVEACARFEESRRLDPEAVGTLLNLGACNQQLKKYVSSQRYYRSALERLRGAPDDERVAIANKGLADVDPRTSSLRVSVPDSARVPGLQIQVDGVDLPADKWDGELPADGGDHVIVANAPGKKELRIDFKLELERARGVVTLTRLEDIPDTRSLGYVVGGVGVAALATGVILGISVASQCGGFFQDSCKAADELPPSERDGKISSLNTQAWISNIGIGLGVAAVGVGTYFVLSSPSGKRVAQVGFAPVSKSGAPGGVVRLQF